MNLPSKSLPCFVEPQKSLSNLIAAKKTIENYGIKYLYHMTSVNNLGSILSKGLVSHNFAHRNALIKRDISDNQVQQRRHNKVIKNGLTVHDYVPLYFSPRNPMLYCRKHIQENIVILGIESLILANSNTVFTNGNAASDDTKFYDDIAMLDKLDWDIITALYWSNFPDGRRIKCAEVLAYPNIPVEKIVKLFCYSEEMVKQVKSILPWASSFQVEVNKMLYF